jgi:hypothetical protein
MNLGLTLSFSNISTKISFFSDFCFDLGFDPERLLRLVMGLVTAVLAAVLFVNMFHLLIAFSLPLDLSTVVIMIGSLTVYCLMFSVATS